MNKIFVIDSAELDGARLHRFLAKMFVTRNNALAEILILRKLNFVFRKSTIFEF